jgi:hypothetical protein
MSKGGLVTPAVNIRVVHRAGYDEFRSFQTFAVLQIR